MPEKKEILVINVHSFSNVGDAALTLATLQQLADNFPEANLSMVADDPESYSGPIPIHPSLYFWLRDGKVSGMPAWKLGRFLFFLPACLLPLVTFRVFRKASYFFTPHLLRPMIKSYLNSDLIVCKPGGFLYSSGLGISFFIAFFIMALGIYADKPLYIFPQSIGPLKKPWECALLRWLARKSRLFMVREPISTEMMRNCGVRKEDLTEIPDSAFGFQGEVLSEPAHWLIENGIDTTKPLLGITMISWDQQASGFKHQDEYESAIAAAVEHFIRVYGGSVVLFVQAWGPSESQDDRVPARRLKSRLSRLSRLHLIEDHLSPGQLKTRYGQMDLFLGTRMHSNIFALGGGVPVLAIEYYPKTRGIMKMVGLEEWVLPIGNLTGEILVSRMDQIWKIRKGLRDHILLKSLELSVNAQQAGKLIGADYVELLT